MFARNYLRKCFNPMPLYEYKCDRCSETFEVIQKFSDEPLTVHVGCGGQVERLISRSALQFKGSGWYVTDYARGKSTSGEPKPAAKSESGDSGSGSSTKTETPAAATSGKPAASK